MKNTIYIVSFLFIQLSINCFIWGQNLESLADFNYNAENIISSDSLISELIEINNGHESLEQFTNSKKPKIIYDDYRINNFNKLEFDGINDRLITNFASSYQDFTFFLVVRSTESRQQTFIDAINSPPRAYLFYQLSSQKFIFRATNPIYAYQASPGQFDFSVFQISFEEENSILKKNNVEIASGNTGTNSLTGVSLGSSYNGSANFKGDFVQLLIFTNSLTSEMSDSISNYLMNKYAPPINLGSDISIPYGFCDTILSSPNYYSNYLWSTGSIDSSIVINEPGIYWLETVDIFGRNSRDTITVIRPPYDDIQIQNQLVCFNEPDTITANLPQGNYTLLQWSDGSTSQTRILNQNELLSYTVSDSLGCLRTSNTALVSIDNSLQNISLGLDTSLCSGNSIQLIQDTSAISNWFWNTQDTTTTLSIDTSGIYILDVSNINGCQNSDTIEVTVIGTAPSLSYSIENEICQGSPLNFVESSTVPPGNTIDEVIWNFGEVDSVFSSSGAQIYQDSGVYNGFLEVSTLEGCSSKESFGITVHPKPIATFEITNHCPYDDITFEASNEYAVPLYSFNWNFDQEGNISNEGSPSYNFGLTGNYNVELIAIDSNECADTVIQTVFIQPAPLADITIVNPCELSALEISDNSSITDTFSIVTYAWNYGDNTSAINPTEEKSFEEYGAYTVQLVLTANNGCVDSTEQNIIVHPNPILNYEVGPACKNTWTVFKDLSTIPQGALAETNWLFNLQFEDSATNTSFNFPTTGIQLLTLSSTSDQGCIVDTTFTVDVSEELNANFNINPDILVSDVPITFVNTSIGADTSYWDFGDGDGLNFNNIIENNLNYSSALNGSYLDIILMTVNDFGCRDTLSKTLLVNEAYYDVSIETLFAQDINGYLTIGVEIANLGTIPVENLALTLKTPENGPIQENWSGSIIQGESEIYIFNAQPSAFISDQDATERFVCVEAQNANISTYLDINQENNTKCKNIEGSEFALVSVYPNPTDEDLTISILLSETSSIYVELYDQTGRMVYNKLNEEMEPGIHDFNMPFSTFESGIYSLRVFDGNLTRVEKIIKR